MEKETVMNLINSMTDNISENTKKINDVFRSLDYRDFNWNSLLHIFSQSDSDDYKVFLAIKTLLENKIDPNLGNIEQNSFIQTAIISGFDYLFVTEIIELAIDYGFNINYVNENCETIMHTAIYTNNCDIGELKNLYVFMSLKGFDSFIVDKYEYNLIDALRCSGYSENDIKEFKEVFKNVKTVDTKSTLDKNEIKELEKYGKILTNKEYKTKPTIGREEELKNLLVTLAQEKKNPILVGKSGVGKTSIIEELSYQIKNNNVPKFLKDKIIYEVNPSQVVSGCRYVGDFEEVMTKIMDLVIKYDLILFIDDIHTIYGVGSSSKKDNDMASMLKYYIDRSNLKIMGTTTEKEYQEYFSKDALKRRFEKIIVLEPPKDILYIIVDKVLDDYVKKNSIPFENDKIKKAIIDIIVDTTSKKKVYNDELNNPDLAISIIDKAFAFAKMYDSEYIKIEHFIESFKFSNRIYEFNKNEAILELENIDSDNIEEEKTKIIKIDFTRRS